MSVMDKLKHNIKKNPMVAVKAIYKVRIEKSFKLFSQLMSEYDDDYKMLLCPYAGTGDVYLASMFVDAYTKKHNIDKYALCVIGGANKKVAGLFGFENIMSISNEDADMLMRLSLFLGSDNDRIVVLHHQPPQNYLGIIERMRNYNGLNFTDLFLHGVFGLTLEDKTMPSFNYESLDIYQHFNDEGGLVEGKTVVLSPYVNTLPSLPDWVWANIAYKLKKMGYTVCTNCGAPHERPIQGTLEMRCSFEASVPVIEKCGYFIGIRSGFCDIISSAKCKKIVVYQPYLFWGDGTNLDYFSLNSIGFCDDVIELEYEGVEFLDLVDRILENFEDLSDKK